jgi:glutamate/tyrosine decarboxylase-like PLP-dependent enzyme
MVQSLPILQKALDKLQEGFASLPALQDDADWANIEAVLMRTAERMQDNFPYFHPLYAGQMLKPPHPVARLAYMLSMWVNPNNHALDGGRASSAMEKEAVASIARMFGWNEHLGHLTGGGTMANLEALWVAGRLHPGKTIVGSELAHYTHERISEVLGLKFEKIGCDRAGRMDLDLLEQKLQTGTVGTVVVTMGTTGLGSVDPLEGVLKLQQQYGFRIHADAAYGGYFRLANNLTAETAAQYAAMSRVDSIVIDPHKHGMQPYGCGCILFRDPAVGQLYHHNSPYTYFSSAELHLGEISLECSRAGAAAVGLWATMELFPLEQGGVFAGQIGKSRAAAVKLYEKICANRQFIPLLAPETDIVVWAKRSGSLSEISRTSRDLFERAAGKNLHLALFNYPARLLPAHWEGITTDQEYVTCLRSCLMKPEHEAWVETIWAIMLEIGG